MTASQFEWLPRCADWKERFTTIGNDATFKNLIALSRYQLDFIQTLKLDRGLTKATFGGIPSDYPDPLKIAILGSSTVDHLTASINVSLLRRGLWAKFYVPDYGQIEQELLNPTSQLSAFGPDIVLFAFDIRYVVGDGLRSEQSPADIVNVAIDQMRLNWQTALRQFKCQVIQQSFLPIFPCLMGSNEHRLKSSPAQIITAVNERLREVADVDQVDLLAIDQYAAQEGLHVWHDATLWHRAKQEVSPAASPMYGELVARVIAARQGKSAKCLVLDLDNTLWGGVIGDDGLNGIVLGQGSARGEAFSAFQTYVKLLAQRGVILAVCSKNDEANALEAFDSHPEMVLKADDIAVFVANWKDKASNLRDISARLNIGIDSLVFVDDNPFERDLIRAELPDIQVPELPIDPAFYANTIAAAGYFESLTVTDEDKERNRLYRSNAERVNLQESVTDLDGYLKSLDMQLSWGRFNNANLGRVTQLINKTNQFNLTTIRYTDSQVRDILDDNHRLGMQFRLADRFGDNGIIGVVIGRFDGTSLFVETWLMSCRVLGRGAENAIFDVVVAQARALGALSIIGTFRPTAKNGMVKDLFPSLGFEGPTQSTDTATVWTLSIENYRPANFHIIIKED